MKISYVNKLKAINSKYYLFKSVIMMYEMYELNYVK